MKKQSLGILHKKRKSAIRHVPAAKKRVLVADDDEGIRDIFAIIFDKAGYAVELKSDGEDILNNKFRLPDIFLIDKQLSSYNGLDICRYLKGQTRTKDIPVIMISATPDIGSLSHEAGADTFIEKPFDITSLLQVVAQYIGEKIEE